MSNFLCDIKGHEPCDENIGGGECVIHRTDVIHCYRCGYEAIHIPKPIKLAVKVISWLPWVATGMIVYSAL